MRLLDIVRLLRTTLDVREVLLLYSEECAELAPHRGVRFAPHEHNPFIDIGGSAKSACE